MKLTGSLDAGQVTQLWMEREQLFRQHQLELGAGMKIDSAGVAFLVKWGQACRAANQQLTIHGASPELVRLFALYGVSPLFELNPLQ